MVLEFRQGKAWVGKGAHLAPSNGTQALPSVRERRSPSNVPFAAPVLGGVAYPAGLG